MSCWLHFSVLSSLSTSPIICPTDWSDLSWLSVLVTSLRLSLSSKRSKNGYGVTFAKVLFLFGVLRVLHLIFLKKLVSLFRHFKKKLNFESIPPLLRQSIENLIKLWLIFYHHTSKLLSENIKHSGQNMKRKSIACAPLFFVLCLIILSRLLLSFLPSYYLNLIERLLFLVLFDFDSHFCRWVFTLSFSSLIALWEMYSILIAFQIAINRLFLNWLSFAFLLLSKDLLSLELSVFVNTAVSQ